MQLSQIKIPIHDQTAEEEKLLDDHPINHSILRNLEDPTAVNTAYFNLI